MGTEPLAKAGFEIRRLDTAGPDDVAVLFEAVLPGFIQSIQDGGPAAFLEDSASFALGAYVDGIPVALAWESRCGHRAVA